MSDVASQACNPFSRRIKESGLLWIHFAFLAGLVAWTAADPYVEGLITAFVSALGGAADVAEVLDEAMAIAGRARVYVFGSLIAAVCVAGFGWLWGGYKVGKQRTSLRSLLVFTALVGLWCGFLLSYPWVAWQGKRLRMVRQTNELEKVAEHLRSDWPATDGELESVGPFMAYPFGQPSTLLLLTPPQVSGGGAAAISTIERSSEGALQFLLSGPDGGDWVEWHPNDRLPRSFVGGLDDHHELVTYLRLGRGWFLVRYT